MKYMLLIHQGDTPTPRSPDDWATLSEDEQKAVYADYQTINETRGVTSGLARLLQVPEAAEDTMGSSAGAVLRSLPREPLRR